MTEKGFLSLLFVTGHESTRKFINEALPRETLRERNVGSFKFCGTGAGALDEYSFNFPDIVFVEDVPDMKISELMTKFIQEDAGAFLVYLATNPTVAAINALTKLGVKGVITKPFSASSFDRYIQYFFKDKYKKSWNEVQAFSDKGKRKF